MPRKTKKSELQVGDAAGETRDGDGENVFQGYRSVFGREKHVVLYTERLYLFRVRLTDTDSNIFESYYRLLKSTTPFIIHHKCLVITHPYQ